jgi:hypothetical protein
MDNYLKIWVKALDILRKTPTPNAGFKNAWGYTSTLLQTFMPWCLLSRGPIYDFLYTRRHIALYQQPNRQNNFFTKKKNNNNKINK